MVVTVARKTEVGRKVATAGKGKKSRVKIAENAAELPSLEPQSSASQQEHAVGVSSSLELGATVEVECCPGTSVEADGGASKRVQPTVMLGKCYVAVLSILQQLLDV